MNLRGSSKDEPAYRLRGGPFASAGYKYATKHAYHLTNIHVLSCLFAPSKGGEPGNARKLEILVTVDFSAF